MKTAYSYIRFSTKKQAGGDSLARQSETTADYCAANGLVLDDSLHLADLGVSAFRGKNAQSGGSIARFLDAVRTGEVEPGSALIIESLDRLTRDTPRKAIRLLLDILESGIEVHLTASRKVFYPQNDEDEEKEKRDPGNELILAVADSMRAHGESAGKSRLLKSAFAAKREKAKAGEKVRMQGMLPWWLEKAPDKSIICPPEKAELLKRIFEMMAGGMSSIKISSTLNAEPGRLRKWVPATVCRLIKSDSPMGVLKTPVITIEGYYPAVVPVKLIAEARSMLDKNNLCEIGRKPNPDRMPNILKGILTYANTGTPLWLAWKKFKSKLTGYYISRDTDCNPLCRFNSNQVEGILISALAELKHEDTQIKIPVEDSARRRLEDKLSKLNREIANMLVAVRAGSEAMVRPLLEAEDERKIITAELEIVKRKAPTPLPAATLQAAKGFSMDDLRIPARREELAVAIRKLVSNIKIAGRGGDLGISKEDAAKFDYALADAVSRRDCEFITDLTPIRGRVSMHMLISFRTGAKRAISRAIWPGLDMEVPILALRIDSLTPSKWDGSKVTWNATIEQIESRRKARRNSTENQ